MKFLSLAILAMFLINSCGMGPKDGRDGKDAVQCSQLKMENQLFFICDGKEYVLEGGKLGPVGPQGPKGDKGDEGKVGPQGDQGQPGDPGATFAKKLRCSGEMDAGGNRSHSFVAYYSEMDSGDSYLTLKISFENYYGKTFGSHFPPGVDVEVSDNLFRATASGDSVEVEKVATGDRMTLDCEGA